MNVSVPIPSQAGLAKARNERTPEAIPILKRVSAFFAYFNKTWMPLSMSWSLAGRIAAAKKIGVPLDRIPTTTNHLEGFNSALKASYLPR